MKMPEKTSSFSSSVASSTHLISKDVSSESSRRSAIIVLVIANLIALLALWQQHNVQHRDLADISWIAGHPSFHHQQQQQQQQQQQLTSQEQNSRRHLLESPPSEASREQELSAAYSLHGKRILVAIAAFDFSQLPHLEEVLGSYHDVCVAGATVQVVIHTTIAWPVPFLDMLRTRMTCTNFKLEIVLKLSSIRLHLVDCHRQLFYERLEDYDLFVYTEDDIRVTPRTIATYLQETKRVEQLVTAYNRRAGNPQQFKPSDFNVGIVRYEYNFPSNVVMDDSTRHVTENVTRVYWEHSSFKPPTVPNAIDHVPQEPLEKEPYVHMKNHHQGMFLATRELLQEWKVRPNCQFDVASNRPGRKNQPSQPLFGTQRVWMSSMHLYGNKRGCGVQQVLPMAAFGALTVHHIPNKNYRRVGQYRTRDMVKDETVEVSTEQLLDALQLHLALTDAYPLSPSSSTADIRVSMYISPEIVEKNKQDPSWKANLDAFDAYLARGGVLSAADRENTSLH